MKNDKFFSISGKIFSIMMLLFTLNSVNFAQEIVFTFTGTTLKEDLGTYLKWQAYLKKHSKMDIEIKFARTYAEAISNIKNKKSDISYICGSTYTILKDTNDARLLVIPVTNGKNIYYADVIALKNSKYKTILDFKDRVFAFTDPESTSGSISPTYKIIKNGYRINSFFSKLIYTYDHGESIKAVLDAFVDGASIDSLVLTQYAKKHPKDIKKLKIVEKLGPFTISPIVVNTGMSNKTFSKLQEIFLNMHKSKDGKEILKRLNLDKFEKPNEQSYAKVYDMRKYLDQIK